MRVAVFALAFIFIQTQGFSSQGQAQPQTAGDFVAGLYSLVSAEGGKLPDWDKVKACFLKEAVVVLRTSRTTLTPFTLEGFIKDFVDFYEKPFKRGEASVVPKDSGFTEKVVRMKSWEYGDMAHVLVLYEAKITGFAMPPQQGVDSWLLVRRDGRWLIPTQTWPGWDGDCPDGIRMIALVSHDQGHTWPEYLDVMRETQHRAVYFWESKIVELADGRLLATAWAYDDVSKTDRPNQYAISTDGGKSWSVPASTGLLGQTLTPLVLDDDRILCVYRRMDQPGLWANLARLEGDRWVNVGDAPLWGQQAAGLTATTENMAHNFNVLRFGAPCVTHLVDGTVFVAFWCYEDCVSVIRWFKLDIGG